MTSLVIELASKCENGKLQVRPLTDLKTAKIVADLNQGKNENG